MARSRRACVVSRGIGFLLVALAQVPAAEAQEAWDSVYIANSKVGHIHIQVSPVKDKGREFVRVRVDTVLTFKRAKDQVTMELKYGTIETPEGQVLKLETRTLSGPAEVRTYGEVKDDKMNLVLSGGGQSQRMEIPWGPDVRGPYAAELSLSRQPIKPGENRDVKTFIPELNKVCVTHLAAKEMEKVELGGGANELLLRVESSITLDNAPLPGMKSTFWVDAGGQILKSFTDAFGGMVTYRTTRTAALAPAAGKLDLIALSILRVTPRIRDSETTRHVVYRVTMKEDDPTKVFPADRRQTVKSSGDDHSATLEVRTAGPDLGEPGPATVDDEYLQPNTLINSTDSRVVELMHKAVGNERDPWAKAVAIERWVFKNMDRKNFAVAFADAAAVARNLEGDCSEHSVLTAAMCRATGVPARVAIGMVYAQPLGGFGFHMWNEVYVNRRWVAIDSAFDQTEVDAAHIKLAETSLAGVSPYETFLTVVRVFDKTTIEPREIR